MALRPLISAAVQWQTVHAPWISTGRLLTVFYVIIIGDITLNLPPPDAGLHYAALRCLGAGTRLEDPLLLPPTPVALEDRLRLASEHDRLLHHYLRKTVTELSPVLPADMLDWPALGDADITPISLDNEPDWQILNAGAHVQVWLGDTLKTPDAVVLAIVTNGKSWTALLASSEIPPDSLGSPKLKPELRVKTLATSCEKPTLKK